MPSPLAVSYLLLTLPCDAHFPLSFLYSTRMNYISFAIQLINVVGPYRRLDSGHHARCSDSADRGWLWYVAPTVSSTCSSPRHCSCFFFSTSSSLYLSMFFLLLYFDPHELYYDVVYRARQRYCHSNRYPYELQITPEMHGKQFEFVKKNGSVF